MGQPKNMGQVTVNINGAFSQSKPVRYGRNSDPDPEWWKEETLDGRLIWPKQIDPMTRRPVAVTYRNEVDDVDTQS